MVKVLIVQEAIKKLTGCTDDEATLFARLAEADILRETNRSYVPEALLSTQIDIAVIRYNRQGTEGETGRGQGGVTVSFDSLPEYIVKAVKSKRLAGVGGHAFESEQNANLSSQKANT